MLRQVSLNATVFFIRNVNCSNKHKILPSCSLALFLSLPPLLQPTPPPPLPFPPCLQPSSALSVPWPIVWPPWLFIREVRAGWHCASVCGQAVFTSVWPWSLEPGTWSCAPVHPGHHPEDCSKTCGPTFTQAQTLQDCLMNSLQSQRAMHVLLHN